jgi:UDP-glucose 4-epimerase
MKTVIIAPERVKLDIRDGSACRAALHGVDTVIHGAAVTPASGTTLTAARLAFDINLGSTVNLVEACEDRGARLLHLSSASVYGGALSGPLDEMTTCPRPSSAYGISKLAAEQLVASRSIHGLQGCVLRLGSVFGPHERGTGLRDTLSALYQVTQAVRSGRPVCLPRAGLRDWIYARDAAAAILAAVSLEDWPDVPVNIAAPTEWSVADWCESLARHIDVDWQIDPANPTIDFHGPTDRPPLATGRMRDLLGFCPRYSCDTACDDYFGWLKEHDL